MVLINCYRAQAQLFTDGISLSSEEGTTQGDPLAMAMFGLASLPLIRAVATTESEQIWFADDAAAGGKLLSVRQWWDRLIQIGPMYGYFPQACKTSLVVKEEILMLEEAAKVFKGIPIEICTGKRYLGGSVGTDSFASQFMSSKIEEWTAEVEWLA